MYDPRAMHTRFNLSPLSRLQRGMLANQKVPLTATSSPLRDVCMVGEMTQVGARIIKYRESYYTYGTGRERGAPMPPYWLSVPTLLVDGGCGTIFFSLCCLLACGRYLGGAKRVNEGRVPDCKHRARASESAIRSWAPHSALKQNILGRTRECEFCTVRT